MYNIHCIRLIIWPPYPPVPAECVMPKCIYYLYFFSEISIYFCVPIFITRALWHNSKHNKCAPSGIERFGGVLGPCLIIFCAVTKKKKKGRERRNVLREETYYKECRGNINPTSVQTCSICCMLRDYDENGLTVGFRYCVPLSWNYDKLLSRTIIFGIAPPTQKCGREKHAQGCNKRLF